MLCITTIFNIMKKNHFLWVFFIVVVIPIIVNVISDLISNRLIDESDEAEQLT
jgi:hypothetical protein